MTVGVKTVLRLS